MTGQFPRDFGEWMLKMERQSKNALRNSARARQDTRDAIVEVIDRVLPGTPAAPVEITANGSLYEDASGAWRGRIDVDFPDVVFSTDGKPVTVTGYEMFGYEEALFEGSTPVWQQYGGSDTSSITRVDLPPGLWYVMKVRAVGGEWSSTFRVRTAHDTTPPPQPTKPTAEVFLGAITVKWDGKAVTGEMPADFEAAVLCVDTEPSPGLDKAVTRLDLHEKIFVITGAKYYTPVYIRLIAVDTSGNLSPWSEQVVAMTKPLVDADIILGEIDAGKTRIINAGKLMLETGKELSDKLQEADTAISNTRKSLEGPGGLTERLAGAETKLQDVGALTMADGTTLNKKLSDNATAIANTQTSLTGPGGLASRITGAETKLADVGALTYATGQTLRQKLTIADTAISTAQGQLNTLKDTTVPKLNTDLTAATGRLTTAEGKITAAQTDLTTAKTDIAAAKKSITDNKAIMDGAVTRLTTAEGEITSAKTRLGTAEGKLTTLSNTTLPGLTTELATAKGRIDSAQTAINLIPGDIASAKTAAIAAAVAEAEAKDKAALAVAATDAQTKATKALNDAKSDATSKANAVREEALAAAREAAGLAGTMGRTWFQSEAPPLGRNFSWEGTANDSASVETADNGSVLRRNLFRNPGLTADKYLSAWGGNGNAIVGSMVAAPWSASGRARSVRWGTVASSITGDFGVTIKHIAEELGPGETFTVELKVVSNRDGTNLNQPSFYSSVSGTAITLARSASANAMVAGKPYTLWATGNLLAAADPSARLIASMRNLVAGDTFEYSEVIAYAGEYDPAKSAWFWGNTEDERAGDLWIDTDEGNTPKRWDSLRNEWTAVTDQRAIDAAIAAAASDATAKADKALADAKTDATSKAEAARKAAVEAAATDAQTKATAAQRAAEEAAAATAQSKVDTAKAATLTAAAADAKTKADEAQRLATAAAAEETLLKANGARTDAIAAAAADAKTKADTAQRLATEAAAADATSKANKALADATATAASVATEKANAAQAAAINASALDASFKADEAEKRAKAVAATAQSAADKAIADALAAAGLAGTKGKTLIQSTAPGAEDRNKMTLWIDTTGGANTPKQWTTGTTWVAVTDKVAADAATVAAQAVSDASAAAGAARSAQSAADSAIAAAGTKTTILTSTSNPSGVAAVGTLWRKEDAQHNIIGRWRYTGGTPAWQAELVSSDLIDNLDVGKLSVGSGVINDLVAQKIAAATATFQKADIGNLTVTGDSLLNNVVAAKIAAGVGEFLSVTTDQLTAGSGNINNLVAQKIAAGTAAFQKADISNLTAGTANMTQAVIEKLVANTAKFQTVTVDNITATATANLNNVVAQRIAAGTASFQTVDAKNLFVTGTSSLSEVVAKRLAAETAEFINLSVDQLVVTGTANIKEAVANKLFANIFAANKISTNHMLVGSFSNLIENGGFEYGSASWEAVAKWSYETTGGRQGPGCLKVTGIDERIFGPATLPFVQIEAGDSYRVSGWVKTNATTGNTRAEFCMYYYDGTGKFLTNSNFNISATTKDTAGNVFVPNEWHQYSYLFKPPATAALFRVRINALAVHVDQEYYFDDMAVVKAADATLLVDGSVTAKSITASEEMSAKVGQFLTLGVDQLTVAGTANMKDAVADRMFANLFSTRKLTANQIYVGEGGNLFAADMMDPGWDSSADLITQYKDGGRDGGPSMVIETSPNQVGTYFGLLVKDRAKAPRLIAGQKYRISAFVRGNAAIPVNGVRLYVRLFKLNSTVTTGYTWASPSSVPNSVVIPANTWDKLEGFFTVPEGTDVVAVVGVYSMAGTTANVRFSDVIIQEAITPELIVDGAIIAKHITASEEMGAKIGKFIKLEVTDLVSTGSAKINDAVITKLFTETFATNKLTAGQVLIGMPGNVIPDVGHNEPAMTAARNAASTMAVSLTNTNDYALVPHATNNTYFRPLGVAQSAAASKDWIPVKPGQVWRWGLDVVTMRAEGSMGFVGRTVDGSAYANTPEPRTVVKVGNGSYVYESEIPEGCAWICPEFILPPGTATTWIDQGSMFMYQVIDNTLIVKGAITTEKLTVTASMTAALLKAKKVEAIEIDANSLKADTAWIGILRTGILTADVVTSTHIKSDSITADLLKADAITSKHTLTGPLIRSAASGARTEMNNQGIRVLNASNVELVRLGYGIATGMSIRNPINGVMAPLSNMVFGAEYFTATVPMDYVADTSRQATAPDMAAYGFRYVPRTASAAFEYTAVSESALLMWEAIVDIWNTNTRFPLSSTEYVPFELGMNIYNVVGTGVPGDLIDVGNFGRYVTGWTKTKVGSSPPPTSAYDGSVQGMGVATGLTPGSKYKVPVYLQAPNYQIGGALAGPLNARIRSIRLVIIPR